jgi:hypothetical protein
MRGYLDSVLSLAAAAVALDAVPLAIAVLGGMYLERHRPPATIWAAYPAAVVVRCLLTLLAATRRTVGEPPAGLPTRLLAVGLVAAVLLGLPVLAAQLLPDSLAPAVRAAIAMTIGTAAAVMAAPGLVLTVGCLLTGDCL